MIKPTLAFLLLAGSLLHAGEVFRKPFELKLRIDKDRFYTETFPKLPYVDKTHVYLVNGDNFGVNLRSAKGVQEPVYQPDPAKADVAFAFSQKVGDDGTAMMLLVIKNNTKSRLFMDALMTVPGKNGVATTSILPVGAGLSDFESWPHPIVQLVLRNLRLEKQP